MSREIKFRQPIFDRDDKFLEWHYWGIGIEGTTFKGPLSGGNIRADKTPSYQYTGLKDKNGKEIYEGDILRDPEAIAKVVFEKGAFIAQVKTFGFGWKAYANLWEYLKEWKDVEVIGNIYQNPELLQ